MYNKITFSGNSKNVKNPRWREDFLNRRWIITKKKNILREYIRSSQITEIRKRGKFFKLKMQVRKITINFYPSD
jgi:hypothetical protein